MEHTTAVKKNSDFRKLYSKGRSKTSPLMVIYCRKNRLGHNRLGITVSGKLGCAVRRNRIRRRLREMYRLNEQHMLPGYDIIIVARHRAHDAPFAKLCEAFLSLSASLGLVQSTPEE